MRNFWEQFYRDSKEYLYYPDENFVRLLSWLSLPKRSKFIDLGCGNGRHIKLIKEQGYIVFGMDRYAKPMDDVKDVFWIGDIADMPIQKDVFDVVILWGVLHYLPNAKSFLGELSRIMTDRGYIIASIRNVEDSYLRTILASNQYNLYDETEIREMFFSLNYNIIAIHNAKRSLINRKDLVISHTNIIAQRS